MIRLTVLGLSLFVSGLALADAAPPAPDAGKTADMASTMAQPDMTAVVSGSDSGCALAGHRVSTPASVLLFAGGVLALTFASRRRRTA